MILTSEKKLKNKNTSYNNANIPTAPHQKASNLSTVSAINNTKINSNDISKKIETPIDFIKQKKNFNIHTLFDIAGTKDFLESKAIAMEEIQLEDEILNDKKEDNIKIFNSITSAINNKNNGKTKEKKSKKRRSVECNIKDNNIVPKNNHNTEIKKACTKKFKKSKYKNNDESDNDSNDDKKNNNILIIDKLNSDDSKDSNYIYKFIIDNANESDDKFQEKLEKVIKKVEKNNKKQKEQSTFKFISSNKKSEKEIIRYNSAKALKKNNNNQFMFSEKAKNLMTNDGLDVSSIDSNNIIPVKSNKNTNINTNTKNNEKAFGKDKKLNIFFGEEEKEFINDTKKDSLVSIINDLI